MHKCAASSLRRPAQDHAFIAYRRVPSESWLPGTTPAPVEDAFTSAAWGVVLVGGPVGRTRFGSEGGLFATASPALSKSSESHIRSCRATRDRVAGPNPAGRHHRGGPPTVVSELHPGGGSGDTGRRRPRARCPAAAGAVPGQVCEAGPSRPARASPTQTKAWKGRIWTLVWEHTRHGRRGCGASGGKRRGRGDEGETREKRTGAV